METKDPSAGIPTHPWVPDTRSGKEKEKPRLLETGDIAIWGSPQPTINELQKFLALTPAQDTSKKHYKVVFDLRAESHLVCNDEFTIYESGPGNKVNAGLSPKEIEKKDRIFVETLGFREDGTRTIDLYKLEKSKIPGGEKEPGTTVSETISIHSLETLQEFVTNIGGAYIRLPIVDHQKPTDEIINQLVQELRKLESLRNAGDNVSVLVHCRGGRGRTTTVMLMCDMLLNANKQQLTLENFLEEQARLGGKDFSKSKKKAGTEDVQKDKNTDTEDDTLGANDPLLQKFYRYARDKTGYAEGTSWSDWIDGLDYQPTFTPEADYLAVLHRSQSTTSFQKLTPRSTGSSSSSSSSSNSDDNNKRSPKL